MEAERFLPRGRRVLLLAEGDADRGVKVDPQLTAALRGCPASPGPFPCRRPGCPHPLQVRLVDAVQQPPRRGHRRHRPEQRLAVTQHPDPAHRVRPVSNRHRQVSEHLARHMQRKPPVGVQQCPAHRTRQPRFGGQFPQQRRPGMRHHATPVRAHLDPVPPAATIHLRSAFLQRVIDHSAVRFSPTGKALLRISGPCRPTGVKRPG